MRDVITPNETIYNVKSRYSIKEETEINLKLNFIDPTPQSVIYNSKGEYVGLSSEGFTGEIWIYTGKDKIDFSKLSEAEIRKIDNATPFDTMRGRTVHRLISCQRRLCPKFGLI